MNIRRIPSAVQEGRRPPLNQRPYNCPLLTDELKALLARCWSKEPEDRPTMDEVVADLQAIVATMVDRAASSP